MSEIVRREPVGWGRNPDRMCPVVKCDCGQEVHCTDAWANGCDCNREYSASGHRLAPRSQWGEETGESFA